MTRIVFSAASGDLTVWIRELQALMPDAEVTAFDARAQSGADYAVVWAPPQELFEHERHLRAIFCLGAGVDALLAMPKRPRAVPLVRLGDAGMSVQMAEYVCHAVLRFTREFERYEADMRAGQWQLRKPLLREHFPIGVLGLGVIGARVARALSSFEFAVHGWSRTEHSLEGITCHHGADGLEKLLRATRILVCVLPLTPDTESILCRSNLEKLMPGAYLINVARGAHLVEDDLLALLLEGHLAGACLDVFREEPLPAGHAFWSETRITMTPHIAARTLRANSLAQIAGKIRDHQAGKPIDGIVDPARGY